ncbi:MAG: cytochrome C biogenesis protein [Bdellovibrionaceae bacterium]|nr:cytochrome C biogenesis protein [Pseudobdellovibrionaceae bacterium]
MRAIFSLFFVLFGLSAFGSPTDSLKQLPVQDAGRVKPFDSFARETLQLVYGRQTYKSPSGRKQSAHDVVFTWLITPELWQNVPLVQLNHNGLRESMRLEPVEGHRYPISTLLTNDRMVLHFQELASKRKAEEKLDPFYQAVQRLENQLTIFHAIRMGQAVRVAPKAGDETGWTAVAELDGELKDSFTAVMTTFAKALPLSDSKKAQKVEAATRAFNEALSAFTAKAKAVAAEKYDPSGKVGVEVHYNDLQPFMYAWILYLIASILLLMSWMGGANWAYKVAWGFIAAAFLLHTYGFGLRVYLLGRPPVSNMFETVIWVPWGAVLFAVILEVIQKKKILLLAACLVNVLCLILANLAPTILDSSLQPLEPVLRDNFWLTTHVLIITLSYGAFFLAFAIGDILLVQYLRGEQRYKKQIKEGVQSIYRSQQIGVVLLAAGTILGGVWADYSWGRFWGWDPKETWALIALLGYLAILHGRLVGLVKDFGMVVWSIVTFSLVIMAWYGVNYVLGAGLHSYGFGAGGVEYVTGFVFVHVLFVIYVAVVRQARLKEGPAA